MEGPPPQPTYTREEMDAILKRALELQQTRANGITRDELVAAAGEVGISREEIEAAAREIDLAKARAPQSQRTAPTPPAGLDQARSDAVRRFWHRAGVYGVITFIVFVVNMRTQAHWGRWVITGLVISLAMRALRAFGGGAGDAEGRRARVGDEPRLRVDSRAEDRLDDDSGADDAKRRARR